MYHPTLGQWISRDPIGYGDAMNTYAYGGASPTGSVDPSGLANAAYAAQQAAIADLDRLVVELEGELAKAEGDFQAACRRFGEIWDRQWYDRKALDLEHRRIEQRITGARCREIESELSLLRGDGIIRRWASEVDLTQPDVDIAIVAGPNRGANVGQMGISAGTGMLGIMLDQAGKIRIEDYEKVLLYFRAQGLSDEAGRGLRSALEAKLAHTDDAILDAWTRYIAKGRKAKGIPVHDRTGRWWHSSPKYNRYARIMRAGGRALVVLSIAVEVKGIADAPPEATVREIVRAAAGWGGAWAGGLIGAEFAVYTSNPYAAGAMILACAVAGGLGGEAAVDAIFDVPEGHPPIMGARAVMNLLGSRR